MFLASAYDYSGVNDRHRKRMLSETIRVEFMRFWWKFSMQRIGFEKLPDFLIISASINGS